MQFLTTLVGGSENTVFTALLALGIVLALIVLGLWSLKFFFRASTNLVRGRNRRLTVIDQVAIDQRRQLIIVRRDNVEHLILTGGPQDLVVESGIPVDKPNGGLPLRRPGIAATVSAPAGAATPAPAADPAPPAQPEAVALSSANMERLRDIARPAVRRPGSLRHTGLMRPVTRMDAAVIPMNPDAADRRAVDSAKTSTANDMSGQANLGAGTFHGDGAHAEGN